MKISVITVCLNHPNLYKTINSVLNQTYKDVEYWVIDGNSTNDVTLNAIDQFRNSDCLHIVSETDKGIYDAMNKGINLSSGDYLIFLNAGDAFYCNESLETLFTGANGEDIIYGDLEVITKIPYVKRYPEKLSFGFFLRESLPHPATLIKRELFIKFGLYSTDMLIAADWAFFLKATCLQNVSYKYVPNVISSFETDGISSNPFNQESINLEKLSFLRDNFSAFYYEYMELMMLKDQFQQLKNSRLRKYLSYVFKQLKA